MLESPRLETYLSDAFHSCASTMFHWFILGTGRITLLTPLTCASDHTCLFPAILAILGVHDWSYTRKKYLIPENLYGIH